MQSENDPAENELRGVDGWLLIFCLWLVLLGPLLALMSLLDMWNKIGPHPFPVQKELAIILTIIAAGMAIYGFIVGIVLWRGHERGRNIAGLFLVIWLFVAVGLDVASFSWAGQHFGPLAAQTLSRIMAPRALVEIGMILGWLGYFAFSRRVRNTYG